MPTCAHLRVYTGFYYTVHGCRIGFPDYFNFQGSGTSQERNRLGCSVTIMLPSSISTAPPYLMSSANLEQVFYPLQVIKGIKQDRSQVDL